MQMQEDDDGDDAGDPGEEAWREYRRGTISLNFAALELDVEDHQRLDWALASIQAAAPSFRRTTADLIDAIEALGLVFEIARADAEIDGLIGDIRAEREAREK